MRATIDLAEYRRQLANYQRFAWRFEQQPSYRVDYEREQFDRFLAGSPESPDDNADLKSWFDRVRTWTAAGKTIGRVRIVEDPPTDYQRWMLWMDRWNRESGETIDYLTRQRATEAGVLPSFGGADWWLFDDQRLLLMHMDEKGNRVKAEIIVDEPEVAVARRTRELALKTVHGDAAAKGANEGAPNS